MAEFTGGNEKYISIREPIVFENETESKYEVCAEIIFHKSGIYEVSVVGNKTIVSEVSKLRTGKWIKNNNGTWSCNQCHSWIPDEQHYYAKWCLYCGAKMEG